MKTVSEQMELARKAQAIVNDYTQEQIDEICLAIGWEVYEDENIAKLAKMAVEETGYGNVQSKIIKHKRKVGGVLHDIKGAKSVGLIERNEETGISKYAKPVGVVCAILPATNPTATCGGKAVGILKGRNAVIFKPSSRALKSTTEAINMMRAGLRKVGAPEDLIQVLEDPSREAITELMKVSDLIVATGSGQVVRAAYSSGTPAYGVGPGNPPVVLDRGYDLTDAVKMTITAVGSDNGILCDGDNMLLHPAEEEKALFDTMRQEGVVVFDKPEDVDKFREVLFVNGKSNPALVGKDAPVIAKAAGFDIPETTKVIALKVNAVGSADILNKEIMGPVVVTKGYDTFEDAVSMAIQNMTESGGIGHTAGIFSNDENHIRYYSERIPVARVLVNQPTPDAWGPATNSLSPAVSEGCGSWGNNILAGNVDYIHLINVSKAVMPLKVELPDGEKLFAD